MFRWFVCQSNNINLRSQVGTLADHNPFELHVEDDWPTISNPASHVKVFLAPIGALLPETSDDVPDVGGLGAKHVGAERKAN